MVEAGSSAEEVTRRERHRQAVNQVSVGNSITSMRLIGALDWTDFFEHASLVEHELRADPAGAYAEMDPATRDAYRHQVERLAERSGVSEVDVARRAVARSMAQADPDDAAERRRHVGYFLVDAGRAALEAELGYRPSIGERVRRAMLAGPAGVYLGAIGVLLLLALAAPILLTRALGVEPWLLALLALLLVLPASEIAVSLVNLDITMIAASASVAQAPVRSGHPRVVPHAGGRADLADRAERSSEARGGSGDPVPGEPGPESSLRAPDRLSRRRTRRAADGCCAAGSRPARASRSSIVAMLKGGGTVLPPPPPAPLEPAPGRLDGLGAQAGQARGAEPPAARRRGDQLRPAGRRTSMPSETSATSSPWTPTRSSRAMSRAVWSARSLTP